MFSIIQVMSLIFMSPFSRVQHVVIEWVYSPQSEELDTYLRTSEVFFVFVHRACSACTIPSCRACQQVSGKQKMGEWTSAFTIGFSNRRIIQHIPADLTCVYHYLAMGLINSLLINTFQSTLFATFVTPPELLTVPTND